MKTGSRLILKHQDFMYLPLFYVRQINARYIFILIITLCCRQSNAQDHLFTRHDVSLKGIASENQIRQIIPDSQGYYWVITSSGKLIKWDGIYFSSVDSIPEDRISLKQTSLFYQHKEDGSNYFHDNNTDKYFYIDVRGRLRLLKGPLKNERRFFSYVGTYSSISRQLQEIRNLSAPEVFKKFEEQAMMPTGVIRFGTGNDEIYQRLGRQLLYYSNGMVVPLIENNQTKIFTIQIGKSLLVMIGDNFRVYNKGMVVASGSKKSLGLSQNFLQGETDETQWFKQFGDSSFFVSGKSIYLCSFEKGKLSVNEYFHIDNPSLYSGFNCDLKHDRVFLYRISGGFSYFDRKKILNKDLSDRPKANIVYSIVRNKYGNLFTNHALYQKIDTCQTCPFMYSNVSSAFMYQGKLWYFCSGIAYSFNEQGKKLNKIQLPANLVASLQSLVETDSVVYLILNRKLCKLSGMPGKEKITELSFTDNNRKLAFRYITTGGNNRLYALVDQCIYRLDVTNLKAEKIAQTPFDISRSITYDPDNNCLLGCAYGIGICVISLKDNSIRSLPLDPDRFLVNSHYFIKDKDGDFFIPTNSGLFYLNGVAFKEYLNGKGPFPTYIAVENSFGLAPVEYNGGFSNGGIVVDDSIYFSSMEGVVGIKPSYIKSLFASALPLPKMESVMIDRKPADIAELKSISSFYKRLSFYFSAPYINYPGIKLQHRFIGYRDTMWHSNNDKYFDVDFLPPGSYTLEVRTTRVNSSIVYRMPVYIKEVWYKTTLAKILFFISFLAFVGVLIFSWIQRERNRTLTAINNNRKEFFQIIAHDLRSPIRYYQGLAEIGIELLKQGDTKRLKKIGHEIDETGLRMENLLNNLFNWSLIDQKNGAAPLEETQIKVLLDQILPAYKKIASGKNISISETGTLDKVITINKPWVSLIIRNLLDNAIKNSPEFSHIYVDWTVKQRHIQLIVTNVIIEQNRENLIKMLAFVNNDQDDEKEHIIGFGLKIISQLLKKMEGSLQVKIQDEQIIWDVIIPLKK